MLLSRWQEVRREKHLITDNIPEYGIVENTLGSVEHFILI